MYLELYINIYIGKLIKKKSLIIVAAPQTNIFGSTAPSTFGTQSTGFGQTGFGQPNQVIFKYIFQS